MDRIKDKDIEGYQVQYVAELEERMEEEIYRIQDQRSSDVRGVFRVKEP